MFISKHEKKGMMDLLENLTNVKARHELKFHDMEEIITLLQRKITALSEAVDVVRAELHGLQAPVYQLLNANNLDIELNEEKIPVVRKRKNKR